MPVRAPKPARAGNPCRPSLSSAFGVQPRRNRLSARQLAVDDALRTAAEAAAGQAGVATGPAVELVAAQPALEPVAAAAPAEAVVAVDALDHVGAAEAEDPVCGRCADQQLGTAGADLVDDDAAAARQLPGADVAAAADLALDAALIGGRAGGALVDRRARLPQSMRLGRASVVEAREDLGAAVEHVTGSALVVAAVGV